MVSSQKEKDYVFASARVRSVEKNLLTKDKAEAMIDSKSAEDALKILYDLGYGDGTEGLRAEQFESLLSAETDKTYSFVRGIAPDEKDLYAFLYPYDYHNLKVLLKAEFLNTGQSQQSSSSQSDPEPFLIGVGTIDTARLEAMVRERDFVGMTFAMKNAVLEVIDVFARTRDPQIIDFILDRACYGEMAEAAKATANPYIEGYVGLLIDTINLKTFARLRQMHKSWDVFSQVFLQGGRIQEKLFISSYDEPYEQFAEKLIPYGLTKAMAEGGAMLRESGRFTALERLCDDRLMDYARSAKYVSFGIEPLAGYLIAKEGEIRTARIAMTGLLQGLERDQMAERLRETYA